MALTRITQGVIKPNENYDTHNINSTGIVTATGLNISGNASIGGVLTYEDVTNIDSIGIITARSGVDVDDFLSVGSNIHLGNAGVVTATSFSGDGSGLTGLSADKIFEGNTKAEVIDTGSDGRFVVTTEGTESFSINNLGGFTFNRASDNVIEASGDITIDYKPSGSLKIRNFAKASALYFFPMSDTYPVEIGSGFTSNPIRFYRTGEATIGTGITLSGSTGNIIASGIVTASNFVGDGSSLTNILISSDAQFNTVGGTQSGDAFTGTDAGNNTLYGYGTGTRITSGDNNTHMGYNAGSYTTTNDGTTYIGARAGEDATGGSNTAVGLEALKKSTGSRNSAVGHEAGNSITSGGSNVLFGWRAGDTIVGGSNNVILGYNADVGASSSNNIVIGYDVAAGSSSNEIIIGNSNHTKFTVTGIGLTFATSGNHISGVTTFTGEIHGNGQRLGSLSSSGRFNGLFLTDGNSYYGSNKLFVANGNGFGLDSYGGNDSWLKANSGGGTSGDCWMKTGSSSGGYVYAKGADGVELHHSGTSDKKLETVSGGVNVVGSLTVNGAALQSGIAGIDTTGTSHFNHLSVTGIATFSGTEAIFNRVSFPQSGNKTIVGNMAGGSGPTGTEITVVGYGAGYASSGNKLTAIGRMSGRSVSGTDNTCIGYEAGYSNQGAQKNVFVGKDAGMGNKTGSDNVVVGTDAGEGVWNNANYTNSVILGGEAGATLTSNNSNVIVIGYDAEPSSNSVTNEITLGNSSITNLRVPGIGLTVTSLEAQYGGGLVVAGISSFSDSVDLVDNVELRLGAGGDGVIKSDGANFLIQGGGGGTGSTYVRGRTLILSANGGSGGYNGAVTIDVSGDERVQLKYGSGTKLVTTSSGVTVTGTVSATAFSGSASNVTAIANNSTNIAYRVPFLTAATGSAQLQTDNADGMSYNPSTGELIATKFNGDGSALTGISAGGFSPDAQNNLIAGTNAGANFSGTDAEHNILIGYEAGRNTTSADRNVSIGYNAMYSSGTTNTGGYNIAIGSEPLKKCTSSVYNVCIGTNSGGSLTSGSSNNVLIGTNTGNNFSSDSSDNIALGYGALGASGTNIEGNTVLGYRAGAGVTHKNNVIIGRDAALEWNSVGVTLAHGENNIIIGYNAAPSTTTTDNEITLGNGSITKFRIPGINVVLKDNGGTPTQGHVLTVDASGEASFAAASGGGGSVTSDAQYNTKAGSNSGDAFSGTSAEANTLFGYDTGTEISSGDNNTCIGYRSGESITSGGSNTLVGSITGERITDSGSNTALGYYCLAETTGSSNSAVGAWALKDSGNCHGNSALGMWALYANNSGNYNIGVGMNAAYGVWSSPRDYIIGIGYEALKWSKGDHNIGIGYRAGYAGDSSAYNEGTHNITIGYYSGKQLSTGSDNTIIGPDAGDALASGSNNLILGHDAAASSNSVSNEITLGDTNITKFRVPGVSASISATESVLPAANFNAGVLQEVYMNDTGGGMQSNYNHDVLTYGMVWNGVTNAAGAFTFNIRGNGSTTFDSLTTTNRVTTMTIYSANNNTSNYMTAFKIDGTTQTVKWAGGSAPSAATGSGVDVYSMTIMKTAANTYHVFGNMTNFA